MWVRFIMSTSWQTALRSVSPALRRLRELLAELGFEPKEAKCLSVVPAGWAGV